MSSGTVERTGGVDSNRAAKANRGWLVGPWFDLVLVANVAWPLFLLLQFDESFAGREGLRFWQIYFVTTPHRWITLALVFFDRQRFGERKTAFLCVAAAVVAICLGVRFSTGTLTCLLTIDYLWNAWHFAAQHHGIYRIYDRLSNPQRTTGVSLVVEKWAMRLFLLYVILRVAGATWSVTDWDRWLMVCDWVAVTIPIWLLATSIFRSQAIFGRISNSQSADPQTGATGRNVYLISVMSLYLTLLWAVHTRNPGLVLSLATASALFHATEYLALVSWSVQRRSDGKPDGKSRSDMLGYLTPRWAVAMGVFLLVLGSSGWLLDQHLMRTWLTINVMVAFLHYAYDGMIWKYRPKLQTAPGSSKG